VRTKNFISFVCVAFAALGLHIVLSVVMQALLAPQSTGGVAQLSGPTFLALEFIVRYGVLFIAGAVLCRLIDSVVPLKWCLGLGLLFAVVGLLPWLFWRPPMRDPLSPNVYLFNIGYVMGHLIAPVLGGYFVKRSLYRER
jgi:hypothetical protein